MSTIEIDTTQNVSIRFQTANVLERILARVIDVTVITTFLYACLIPLGMFSVDMDDNYWILITLAVLVIGVSFFYPFMMESIFHGQTIGKMAMSIRVVRADGTEPSVGNYAIRFLVGVFEVTMTMGTVAIVAVLVSKSSQRLGDMAANTLVVRKPKRVTLTQVGMLAAEPDHAILYHGAGKLTAAEVEILREVLLQTKRKHLTPDAITVLLDSTKSRIEQVIDEQAGENVHTVAFLQQVLNDYNAIYQR